MFAGALRSAAPTLAHWPGRPMDTLDSVLKAIAADPKRGIFVSRSGAGEQPELAAWIASRLKANGYIPILQDALFKHADFMRAMDGAFASEARVPALMS